MNLSEPRFQIRSKEVDSSPRLQSLVQSIFRLGMVHLPVLWCESACMDDSNTRYHVLSGHRRIQAAKFSGFSKLYCRILSEQIIEKQAATFAVADNSLGSDLLPGEMVRSLALLGRFYSLDELSALSGALFGNELSKFRIKELLDVAGLSSPWADLLDAGQVTLRSVLQIASRNISCQEDWFHVFSSIKVSSSKQGQMLDAFTEILAREGIDSDQFFADGEVKDILSLKTRDAGQRGEMFRQYLAVRRFPFLEAQKAKVKSKIAELSLPRAIRLEIPENFESREYGLFLKFTNRQSLAQSVQQLQTLSDHNAWDDILSR